MPGNCQPLTIQVIKSERTDSERFYLAFVSKVLAEDPTQTVGVWGRYQELCQGKRLRQQFQLTIPVHGDPSTSLPKAKAKNVLANKMICESTLNLTRLASDDGSHKYSV